ncbi:MAG: tetratricopeptide repeat protein, partial [Gemmatimonadetes bacterium]|nr:tetratricopeptide repeat protein [Gemmatimonadota bacterium]NIQ60270.1 tetratricopeptide repeat protein [Gemmatimonadota bacterium]NIU80488.1 tetratricopeptide repeat protein [Gammaproteobacteria bacterium]NIW38634.1 tetratricopeptide repeat protein [Gemmatimonadota bacterium]NIX48819.1 tetratricopeptide repeat protein [Gemmatimonadota bacterium]
ATGNVQQGLREARLAHELDPLSFIIAFDYGWQLVLARRYDDGIRQLREAADLDPSHPLPPGSLGIAYLAIGSEEVALECLTTALANTPERWDVTVSSLAYGYAVTGRTARARELLGEVLQRAEEEPISEVMLAYVYVGLGDLDEAFHWLREAVAGKDWLVGWGLQDPAFDPLRGDPRFDEILAAARLPT